MGDLIPFPDRTPEQSDFHKEMQMIELESLERRCEDLRRSLGMLAVNERGVDE